MTFPVSQELGEAGIPAPELARISEHDPLPPRPLRHQLGPCQDLAPGTQAQNPLSPQESTKGTSVMWVWAAAGHGLSSTRPGSALGITKNKSLPSGCSGHICRMNELLLSVQIPQQGVIGCKILVKQVKWTSCLLALPWIGMCVPGEE